MNFGRMIRDARLAADMTLKACADRVGVSVAYWSDVEHGRRNPFKGERLPVVARMLALDLRALRKAARNSARTVKIDLAPKSEQHASLVLKFARRVDQLDDKEVQAMNVILERRSK